jgi:AcrR family transcriptional regulator
VLCAERDPRSGRRGEREGGQLLRCAYQAISEHGVHRVSLQETVEMAGVSKGLIPYYFKTKEGWSCGRWSGSCRWWPSGSGRASAAPARRRTRYSGLIRVVRGIGVEL